MTKVSRGRLVDGEHAGWDWGAGREFGFPGTGGVGSSGYGCGYCDGSRVGHGNGFGHGAIHFPIFKGVRC